MATTHDAINPTLTYPDAPGQTDSVDYRYPAELAEADALALGIGVGVGVARDEHLADLLRFRFAMLGGFTVCLMFGVVDWIVVEFIEPGSLRYYYALRGAIALALFGCAASTYQRVPPSPRTLRVLDLFVFTFAAAAIALMCLEYRGISSPYYVGIILVVVCRGAALPTNWRVGVIYFGLPAATYPLTMAAAAVFVPDIAAQFSHSSELGSFFQNLFFLLGAVLLVTVGSHAVWALRRQLFEHRNLGRYRLTRRLGQGGMGHVWAAHHSGLKRDVALKILPLEHAGSAERVGRFEREALATSQLTHPNTIRIYDYGVTADGFWYYAMELLEGGTLDERVRAAGPVSPRLAIHLAIQVCGALTEAHRAGIVHRDIKPSNLFLVGAAGKDEFLKVLDFGIAKVAEQTGALTVTGWIGGSPPYMSPEAAAGHTSDARSDIYSLGAAVYFALTGRPPFQDRTHAEMLHAHRHEPPPALSAVAKQPIPPKLEAVVMRCLEKEPLARFARAEDLARALAEVVEDL